MTEPYNLYNFEAEFKQYLLSGNQNPVSTKNYLSDYRYFCGWFISVHPNETVSHETIRNVLTVTNLESYKTYLLDAHLPVKTINRRLSTMRKFCSFCISQGWLDINTGKSILNIPSSQTLSDKENAVIMQEFRDHLSETSINRHSMATAINDIQEFLNIISSQQSV